MNNKAKSYAVVGAGVLGLTIAMRLREQGHDVTVIEAAEDIGGQAKSWQLGDITWDQHYHVTLMSDFALREVLAKLDVEKDIQWRETKTGVYANKKLYSISNLIEFLTFPPLNIIEKFRLGFTIFYGSKIRNWKRLEKISVSKWLSRWSGKRTFERFWLPLLRSKLGENYKIASASFIWATISRLYAARRSGLKKEMFGYVKGGYATVFTAFKQHLEDTGVTIKLSTKVSAITKTDGVFNITSTDNYSDTFDEVICTLASPLVPKIIPQLNDDEKKLLNNIQYQGVICASVLLKRPISDYYVTNILDDGLPFTGVIEMTALVDKEELGGNHLIYLPRYVTQQDDLINKSDEEIETLFLDGIKKMYPDIHDDDVVTFKLSRVRYVCPIPVLGYSDNIPPIRTSVDGLYLVSSTHITNGTLNVNEAVLLGANSNY